MGTEFDISTARLDVGAWHELADRHGVDLVDVVTTVLTATTTAALPPPWQGDYDAERARTWIAERDDESPTLLVLDTAGGSAVGLVILFDVPLEQEHTVEIRLGYVLAESAWGRGLATELVGGLADAARHDPRVAVLSGGVADGNVASARVLERSGFTPRSTSGGETIYELDVR